LKPVAIACAAIAAVAFALPLAHGAPAAYDPKPWLEDLQQTQEAFATKYANLEWAVFEEEVNLESLFNDTRARVESATSPAEARAAFDRLARKIGDAHVRFSWPSEKTSSGVPGASCAALNYDERMQGAPVAGLVPGYTPLAGAPAGEFPSGTIQVAGHRVGIIKIGVFTPQGYPNLCAAALSALQLNSTTPCDDACADRIETWASERMTHDLADLLRAIKAAKAEVLLVDLTDNGGGTEWAEAVARMVTAIRIKSEQAGFVRGPHWADAFTRKEAELRAAALQASGADRALLEGFADQVAERRREAQIPCDSKPMWRGERPQCRWLGDAFFASGLVDSASSEDLRTKAWARMVFTPMEFDYRDALWHGPLIVLVNGGTGSAAEEFTAVLQDNHAAVVMGAPTAGAGCGHTDGGTPTTLNNSRAVLELPDCARFRSDGSNEVMGIEPDVLVGLRAADGPHRRGMRVAGKLPEAVRRAIEIGHAP
jgi:Peptidase family S41